MNADQKRMLKEKYKARKVTGGIYRIVCRENGRFYLYSTDDMQATRNQFEGSQRLNNCSLPPIQGDWRRFGPNAFSLEELDLLEKGETQTDAEFRRDLKTLLELWSEKLPRESRY